MSQTMLLPILPRDIVEVAGSDAARFIHNYCTANIKAMADGDQQESFFPNEKGRILAHAWIERVGEKYLVTGCPGTAAVLLPHLGKYAIFDDVQLNDRSTAASSFLVVGDGAEGAAREVLDGSADGRFHLTAEATTSCVRVFAKSDRASEIFAGFASLGLVEGDQGDAERIRIMAGVPVVGVDVTDANLVQEAARTDLAVSFDKGCYLGQEPIARLDAMGHTNKELRTVLFDAPVERGAEIQFDGKAVGIATSSADSPAGSATLAVLRKAACVAGSAVTAGSISGTVQPVGR